MKLRNYILGLLLVHTSCSPENRITQPSELYGRSSGKQKVTMSEGLEWNKNRKLNWSDFKCELPTDAKNLAATTHCGFGYRSNGIGIFGRPHIEVKNIFYPELSWVRNEEANRPGLLEHEQLHFDISEIYARRLRLKLSSAKLNYFNAKRKSEAIFKEVYEQYLQRQKTYEEQTEFSLNNKSQKEWGKMIHNELESTSH